MDHFKIAKFYNIVVNLSKFGKKGKKYNNYLKLLLTYYLLTVLKLKIVSTTFSR